MRVETQGFNECALSTMAALLGRPLAEVREVARANGFVRVGHHHILSKTALALDPSGRLLALFCGFWGRSLSSESREKHRIAALGPRTRTLPAVGRGVVRLRNVRRTRGHVAPWENGLVYDPNSPEHPETLQQFRRGYPNFRLDYITKEEDIPCTHSK